MHLRIRTQVSNGSRLDVAVQTYVWRARRAVHVEDAMKADRVLVPLGSPLAEMAIPQALELLSDRPGSTLILLRAVETATLPGSDPTETQLGDVHEAESYLATVAARL